MLSSAAFPEEENNYEIASPLLGRNDRFNNITDDDDDSEQRAASGGGGFDGISNSSSSAQQHQQPNNNNGAGAASGNMDPRLVIRHPLLRALALRCASMHCAADKLPKIFYYIVTEGKMTAMVTIGVYLLFVSLWFPFWLLSLIVTEWGVYALAVLTVFGIGRSVLRMIAFPGASCRVRREIEGEFAKYSVQMLLASLDSVADLASLLLQATAGPDEASTNRRGRLNDLPGIWRTMSLYKDRVLAVHLQVLQSLYDQPTNAASGSATGGSGYLTKYGNNRLLGDIGNLSDLTVRINQSKNCLSIVSVSLFRLTRSIDPLKLILFVP